MRFLAGRVSEAGGAAVMPCKDTGTRSVHMFGHVWNSVRPCLGPFTHLRAHLQSPQSRVRNLAGIPLNILSQEIPLSSVLTPGLGRVGLWQPADQLPGSAPKPALTPVQLVAAHCYPKGALPQFSLLMLGGWLEGPGTIPQPPGT